MLESARFDGDSCIAATGKQISSGCPVTLKFFVDEEQFVHLRKFHQQARDTSFIPGTFFPSLPLSYLATCLSFLTSRPLHNTHIRWWLKQQRQAWLTHHGGEVV